MDPNELLQQLRALLSQPKDAVWMNQTWALFSAHLHESWFSVVLDYAGDHALFSAPDIERLRRQHEALQDHAVWTNPADGTEMVWIPEGDWWTGGFESNRKSVWWSRPKQRRRLPMMGFAMARHPITNAQYARFVRETGYHSPLPYHWPEGGYDPARPCRYLDHWRDGQYPPHKADHPVVYVSWFDAIAYCRWAGLVLPTEWMWEKAARGPDDRRYPWGNQPPRQPDPRGRPVAHVRQQDTCPVGSYAHVRTGYGCQDMIGNVSEWCCGPDTFFIDNQDPYNIPRDALPFQARNRSALQAKQEPVRGSNYSRDKDRLMVCGMRLFRGTMQHHAWCGFRPAYLPTLEHPRESAQEAADWVAIKQTSETVIANTDPYEYYQSFLNHVEQQRTFRAETAQWRANTYGPPTP